MFTRSVKKDNPVGIAVNNKRRNRHLGEIVAAVAFIVLGEGLFDPSYNARLSLSVSESKQGFLQVTNQSLQAFYHVIVPLGAAALYTCSHSAVFGVASIAMVGGLILFSRLKAQPAVAIA